MQETRVWYLHQEDDPVRGNGIPVQYSCLENAKDRGAWRAVVHGATKSQIRLSSEHFPHFCELVRATHFYRRGHWDLERKLLFQGEGGRTEEPSCPGSCAPLTAPWTHLKVSFPSELHQPWRPDGLSPEPALADLIASIQARFPSGTLPGRRPDPSLLGSRPRLPRWNSTGRTQTLPFLVWVAWPAPAPAEGEVGLQGPPYTALAFPSLPPSFSGSLEIH